MKKKLLSLLLAICLVVAMAPAAYAASDEVPEGDGLVIAPNPNAGGAHFTDQYHAGVDFEDMKYVAVSEEEMLAAIEDVRALISDAANAQKVEELFKVAADKYMTIQANVQLLNIYTAQDTTDEESAELYETEYALYVEIFDPFIFLVKDILNSPCKDYFVEQEKLTQEDIDSYLEYGGMSDEEKQINAELAGIDAEYWDAYYDESTTFEYHGTTWDAESLAEAQQKGSITEADYNAISDGLNDAYYQKVGEVYMHALKLNQGLADLDADVDNYVDYAYDYVYSRGYDVETAKAFVAAIREYVVPLADDIYTLYSIDANSNFDKYQEIFEGSYSDDATLDSVRPYIAKMSDELLEAWDYMIGHGLYDIEPRDGKADQGFTTQIDAYGSPFFFNNPYGYVGDFSTIIHEFGHYNNAYWHASGWNDGSCSTDVAEVHSQSLELLFTQYYGDFYGDMAPCFTDLVLYNIISGALINGALFGELEIYAYTTPNVTVDMICDKYLELSEEYGLGDTNPYGWLDVPHLTIQPMYYISYATSGIGALYFFSYALENGYDAATEQYLSFVAQSPYEYFQDQFDTVCGVDPMDPEYVEVIVDTLYEDLDIENRINPTYYSDVDQSNEYYDLITDMTMAGAFVGFPDGTFKTYNPGTRAETAQMLYNIFGGGEEPTKDYFPDDNGTWYEKAVNWCADYGIFYGCDVNGETVFWGDRAINRQELTTVFCRVAGLLGIDTTPKGTMDFADADLIPDWAADSMQWYYENNMLPKDDNGNVNPEKAMSRYHLASYANNIFYVMQNF